MAPVTIWPAVAGAVVLLLGLLVARRELASGGADKIALLGAVFYAAPLAVFGGEHLTIGQSLQAGVPKWMPWPLFWAYLVGVALIAAGLSLAARKLMRWSGTLTGLMILLFVLTIHLPNTMKEPGNRELWAVMFRDLAFAAAGWVLVGSQTEGWGAASRRAMVSIGRICLGVTLVAFGADYLIYPKFAPTVPLAKLTPAWVPFPLFWGYLTGAMLLVGGLAILVNVRARMAAVWLGAVMVAATLALYVPLWMMARGTADLLEGVNYVADTLMFGGVLWILAGGMPKGTTTKPA